MSLSTDTTPEEGFFSIRRQTESHFRREIASMDGEFSPGTFGRSSPSHKQKVLVLQGQAHPYTEWHNSAAIWLEIFTKGSEEVSLISRTVRSLHEWPLYPTAAEAAFSHSLDSMTCPRWEVIVSVAARVPFRSPGGAVCADNPLIGNPHDPSPGGDRTRCESSFTPRRQ
jgi:hypothetical protein